MSQSMARSDVDSPPISPTSRMMIMRMIKREFKANQALAPVPCSAPQQQSVLMRLFIVLSIGMWIFLIIIAYPDIRRLVHTYM